MTTVCRKACGAISIIWLIPALGPAQQAGEQECIVAAARTEPPPLEINDPFVERFSQATACLNNQDTGCAEAAIDGIRARDLGTDGQGALAILEGDIEAMDGSDRRARRAYREALDIDPPHISVQRQAYERLAVLYLRDDDPDSALEELAEVECEILTPRLVYLRSVAEFGVGAYQRSVTTVETAIRAQMALQTEVPSTWITQNQSSRTALKEEGAQAEEGLRCVEETPIGSNISKRTCTTAAERRRRQQVSGEREQFEIERGLGF